MRFEAEDISLISLVRGQIMQPLRWMRATYRVTLVVLSMVFFVTFVLGVILWALTWGLSGAIENMRYLFVGLPAKDPELALTVIGGLAIALIARWTVKGHRWASLLSLTVWSFNFGALLYILAIHCLFGFPSYDFHTIDVKHWRDAQDYSDDLRALPLFLYALLISAVSLLMFWLIGRIHILPRFRRVRELRKLVFADPGELRPMLWIFRRFGNLRFVRFRSLAAIVTYILYSIFLTFGIFQIYYMSLARSHVTTLAMLSDYPGEPYQVYYLQEIFFLAIGFAEGWLTLLIATWCLRASRRLAMMTADNLLRVDSRPPVLYLRSFRSDAIRTSERWGLLRLLYPFRMKTHFAQLIAARCAAIGPVVTIADPKTRIIVPGPAQKSAGHADWHEVVTALMQDAALIIVLMDATENLKWEIESLRASRAIERTLFIFGPTPRDAEPASYAAALVGIIKTLVLPDREIPEGIFERPTEIRALKLEMNRVRILTSRSTTLSDYEMAMGILLET